MNTCKVLFIRGILSALLFCALTLSVFAADNEKTALQSDLEAFPNFSVYRQGTGDGPCLLVVGGIQGDEPGGFSAAALLATKYKITKGSVWVVPNLNFPSIVKNSRGLHGDMNRKFAAIRKNDPELETIRRIQALITRPEVDLVLNLHDGSGFYREKHENNLLSPRRWGQCIVIDQAKVDDDVVQNKQFQNLDAIATAVTNKVNSSLIKPLHAYSIKNTKTRKIDMEMQKTLSYFAVCEGKPAFGLEASKELDASSRVFYHVQLLEAFMDEMGITYERSFELTPSGVKAALNNDILMGLYANRTVFALDNVRPNTAGFIPVSKNVALSASYSSPLLAVLPGKNEWKVHYGNRVLTSFRPEYRDFDYSLPLLDVDIDGVTSSVSMGSMLFVKNNFTVHGIDGVRVNAIGAAEEVNGTESDVLLKRAHFQSRFSLDRDENIYRVEFYKGSAFCGMILINFSKDSNLNLERIPMTAIIESKADENTGR